ncbi:MAG: MBL fold metallo-hydrolase [Bacteroidales bacterium]|nr:MBL fold metallo-hydrolase [Bacteroidales bacterium]
MLNIFSKKPSFEKDTIRLKNGKDLTITFLRHASLLFEYDGKVIYSDPVAEFEGFRIDFEKLPQADLILVSHDHYDHLDCDTIETIGKESTTIVCDETSAKQLADATALHNGDSISLFDGEIEIKAVPAYNITEGHLQFHPKDRDNGYILNLGGTTIYIAGDTEDTTEAYAIKDIDIAFLPVNQPYTMTLQQAANLARAIAPAILYPYHYTDTDIVQLSNLLSDTNIEVRLRKMP